MTGKNDPMTGARSRGGAPTRTIPRTGRAELVVPAPVDAVWDVIADVTRVGEWSHECRRVEWVDGATKAEVGARFRGTNKAGPWTWTRRNEITSADAPNTLVWHTIPQFLFPDSSEWRIDLEPVEGGTRVVQSYRVLRAPAFLARVYALMVPSHRDRTSALVEDLRRLGQVAAGESPDGSQDAKSGTAARTESLRPFGSSQSS